MGVFVLLIFAAAIVGVVYIKQNSEIRKMCRGKNENQKKVIKYLYGGCLTFGKITDSEYDNLVLSVMNGFNLKNRALNKIGIDEDQLREIEPVFFQGYSKTNTFVGKDDKLRSTWYETAWLFFSDTQVYMYKFDWDMMSDNKKENMEEYFYKDIVNFTEASETVEAFRVKNGCTGQEKSREKVNREYSMFGLVVPGDKFYCSTSNVPNAEASIRAMKQKLREKKGN